MIVLMLIVIFVLLALCGCAWLDEHCPGFARHSERMAERIEK